MTQNEATEKRILTGYSHIKEEQLRKSANKFCLIANTSIIPNMKRLCIPVTKENVMRYAKDRGLMIPDYIEQVKSNIREGEHDIVRDMIVKQAEEKARGVLKENPDYSGDVSVSSKATGTVYLSGDVMKVDWNIIKELTAVYVEGEEQIKARERHERAVQAMNDFFKGKAQDIHVCFTVRNGVIYPGECVNYELFI